MKMRAIAVFLCSALVLHLAEGYGMNYWKLRNHVEQHKQQRAKDQVRKDMKEKFFSDPAGFLGPHFIPDQYLEQPLDHFDPMIQGTYKQRWWANTDFWKSPDGPVFLYIGGEGGLFAEVVMSGEHVDLAKEYGALIFAVEHRFYGDSFNDEGLKMDHMRFLSSQQALADLASFHAYVSGKYNLTEQNTWICYGGSYPGALSAWFRLKYPHLVYGAIASSAPVEAQVNFEGYNDVVAASLGDSIVNGSKQCVDNIRKAFQTIDVMLDNGQQEDLSTDFLSCEPLKNPDDIVQFVSNLADPFMGTVQYNGESLGSISDLCVQMTATPNAYDNLRLMNKKFLNRTSQKCADNSWNNYVQMLLNTTKEKIPGGVGIRQWTYQTCTQFGYYQTCDPNTTCIFSKYMSLKSSLDICRQVFNVESPEVYKQVAFTNAYYGSNHPKGTRIVFVNGSIDPWHALSVLKNLSATETAIYIQGTAHCANMESDQPNDPPALRLARKKIDVQVGKWLQEAGRSFQKDNTLYFHQL